jgi:hypothetical protein
MRIALESTHKIEKTIKGRRDIENKFSANDSSNDDLLLEILLDTMCYQSQSVLSKIEYGSKIKSK